MQYQIQSHANPIFETISLLYLLENSSAKEAWVQSLETLSIKQQTTMKHLLADLEKQIREASLIESKLQSFWFSTTHLKHQGDYPCMANLLLTLNPSQLTSFQTFFDSMEQDTAANYLCKVYSDLFEIEPRLDTPQQFLAFLEQEDTLTIASKWNLMLLLHHPHDHLTQLIHAIEKVTQVVEKGLQKHHKMIDDFIKTLHSWFEEANFFETLTGVTLDDNNIPLYPAIIRHNGISLQVQSEHPGLSHLIEFGIHLRTIMDARDADIKGKGLLQQQLKTLSDKTKFEILLLLKQEPHYGQQLADKLDVTTATISYHMNALLTCRLIHVEKIEQRVYYSLHQEHIETMIDTLQQQLLTQRPS